MLRHRLPQEQGLPPTVPYHLALPYNREHRAEHPPLEVTSVMEIKVEGVEVEALQEVLQGVGVEVEVDDITERGAIQEVLVEALQCQKVQR